jgi:hypothetical protein
VNSPSDQPSRHGRAARLADALLADRDRETTETQSITCAGCGRSTVDRGQRCCSPRCERWLADGNPPVDPHLARKALEVPIRAWGEGFCVTEYEDAELAPYLQIPFELPTEQQHATAEAAYTASREAFMRNALATWGPAEGVRRD